MDFYPSTKDNVLYINMQNNYTTTSLEITDLGLAAALILIGYELIDIDRTIPRKSVFIFEDKPESKEDKNDYFNGKLEGSLVNYFDALKNLKTRLYQE